MLTDSEFLHDRDIPRDCEHGTLAKQCELCECKAELAAARAENVECLQAWRKANEEYYFAAKERDAARAELERAIKVVEAAEAAMCIEFPKPLRDAMQRWWDEEAGR
jgi:hypothetical protein